MPYQKVATRPSVASVLSLPSDSHSCPSGNEGRLQGQLLSHPSPSSRSFMRWSPNLPRWPSGFQSPISNRSCSLNGMCQLSPLCLLKVFETMSLWLFLCSFPRNPCALGSQAWQQSVASTLDTYLVIEDLSPGSPYQFRVSASNPWGISLPSEPSEFVRLPEYGESRPCPAPQAGDARHLASSHAHRCRLAVGMAGRHAGGNLELPVASVK